MKSYYQRFLIALAIVLITGYYSNAQQFVINNDSLYQTGAPNTGRVWGYTFGDFYYKGHTDSLTRGGNNQYTGIPQGRNAFQFRRIYLGYDYNITKKFSAELLLSAEDNFPGENPPSISSNASSGDLLANGKEAFFIKLANVKWKNVWNGTDLVIGMQGTPTFANLTEKVWNYRSVERTIVDIRRTPSYDMGIALNGTFDPSTKNFGYDVLVANGTSDKPAASSFKWFYGDVWAKFFDKKLIVDLYADYQRLNWISTWHHDRQMLKAFVAYNTQPITIGVEGFVNNLRGDTKATLLSGASADTIATKAQGISFYVHGDIVPSKLRFFARYDMYNPNKNIDNSKYSNYAGISSPGGYNSPGYRLSYTGSTTGAPVSATSTGDVTAKEQFITAGLDFTPIKNVHLEPNIWYNSYASQLAGVSNKDHDLLYRLTFFYIFGKTYKNTYNQF